jgi:glycosyltransferase involved in cell wall biosynthesis
MDEVIFIAIASYRDPDLENTVKSCYDNAKNPQNLYFSIFSQAEPSEHANLSFIPQNQITYIKTHWTESKGACWAKARANTSIIGKYFLQVDSHSRFINEWDLALIGNYESASKFWGNRVILSTYPDPFEVIDGKDVLLTNSSFKKISPFWNSSAQMVLASMPWEDVEDNVNGDEMFYIGAGFIFSTTDIAKEIPYDEEIYFYGEEVSLALRAYTRGMRIVSPVSKAVYSHYDYTAMSRRLHWQDNPDWGLINLKAQDRLKRILSGDKSFGVFGIESEQLFDQYQKITGINLIKLFS